MANGCDVSKNVTKFLLNTCRLPPRLTKADVQAAISCAAIATQRLAKHEFIGLIPLTTGSAAEFYIEPMLLLVGDTDVMYYYNVHLAIPQGHPPPTRLPAEFHNCLYIFEIINSNYPGYVYLELRYLLTQCIDDGKYVYIGYDDEVFFQNNSEDDDKKDIHGPAVCNVNSGNSLFSTDSVFCVRCLVWPPQAADWSTRHRNYGWPDSATLDRVVSK